MHTQKQVVQTHKRWGVLKGWQLLLLSWLMRNWDFNSVIKSYFFLQRCTWYCPNCDCCFMVQCVCIKTVCLSLINGPSATSSCLSLCSGLWCVCFTDCVLKLARDQIHKNCIFFVIYYRTDLKNCAIWCCLSEKCYFKMKTYAKSVGK